MPIFKNYDPGRVIIVVNGVQIQGFADGTFVKVARKTPSFSDKAGAGGDVVRTKSRDLRATMEITLLPSSPSNDYLSGLVATDEHVDAGVGAVGPVMVKELNGTTVCAGANAWVTQPADTEFGAEPVNRTWLVTVASLSVMNVGGLTA